MSAASVITVSLDGNEVLQLGGVEARMSRLLLADHTRVVAALAKALQVVVEHHPGPSDLIQALDSVETLAALGEPPDATIALGFVGAAIQDARDAFTAAAGATPPTATCN